MPTALYPGSFDPATNGHLDIACRASAIFDKLYVAVYDAPPKNLLFSTEERMGLLRQAFEDFPNITVTCFSGLVVDYARKIGAKVLVRGLRAMTDFELEFQMALLNRKMAPEIEVVCFMTSIQHSFLSSSMIKEIAKLGGAVDGLVPDKVSEALNRKYSGVEDTETIPRYLNS